MNGPALVHDLATAIGGEVRGNTLIIVRDGDRIVLVDCAHTGKVWLELPNVDGRALLGRMSDGVEHLSAMFYAATSEVTC